MIPPSLVRLGEVIKGVNLLWRFVEKENQEAYFNGINQLRKQGRKVLDIVCDGKNLSLGEKLNIPVQMCRFYQQKIIKEI